MDQSLLRYLKELENLRNNQIETLAKVSHDLRSPIHSLKGIADLGIKKVNKTSKSLKSMLERNKQISKSFVIDKPIQELDVICDYFQRIIDISSDAAFLLEDILDSMKLDNDQVRYRMNENKLMDVARSVESRLSAKLGAKGIKLLILDQSEGKTCCFDINRIVQVVSNLVENAYKFSEKNTTITLSVNPTNLEVKDQGAGIPEDHFSSIFEKFKQGGKNSSKGLGLGLFICKKIMADHHGKIEVRNNHDRGASFRIVFGEN
ncbi:MAG: HAMP domain-containing histidine kinase [Deltaproteobacteria bacterium]|nr:HAMP domain-containing histidine kinase [Deltaproteobacteria bacterium]